ncbi:MAG TPA: ATP-binding protein [Thermoanaerobaculia bacterium]|jgi:PAS domain S-box-containing protein|nr:ATP-binding protein [Thermoanaerobaculia bacterium]
MIAPSIPENEGERLAALHRYQILDTTPEEAFDELVQLASMMCGAPIALISLVDTSRQWFKARIGLDVQETPRSVSFCGHALHDSDVFVVHDALADPRFATNPLVVGEPKIRFYAGAPLTSPEGLKLGALCVIDRRPRLLDTRQRSALRALGRQVMVQLELRRQITERSKAERELDRFFDLSLDLLCISGTDGRFKRLNPAFTSVFGYTHDELTSRPFLELVHPDDVEKTARELQNLRLGRKTIRFENRYVCKDGTTKWIAWTASPVPEDGVIYAVARDITGAREVERLKRDFVATVSHELRTPLTSIRGSLGLLAAGLMGELTPEAREMVAVAERNSVRLMSLINDILDFEKLESGKVEMDLRPTPLLRILERSIETTNAFAVQEGVSIELHSSNTAVLADEARIVQVVVNLLSNAVKHSERGARIAIRSHAGPEWVEVKVEDRGSGISAEAQPLLFERFHQIDSGDSRTKPGTGLGLAICKAIVEQHGGSIGVESRLGEGSTFWLRIRSVDPALCAVSA